MPSPGPDQPRNVVKHIPRVSKCQRDEAKIANIILKPLEVWRRRFFKSPSTVLERKSPMQVSLMDV
jgi:hypothetical protein